jgi:hypothetical protein
MRNDSKKLGKKSTAKVVLSDVPKNLSMTEKNLWNIIEKDKHISCRLKEALKEAFFFYLKKAKRTLKSEMTSREIEMLNSSLTPVFLDGKPIHFVEEGRYLGVKEGPQPSVYTLPIANYKINSSGKFA